jgi:hypothetical protein
MEPSKNAGSQAQNDSTTAMPENAKIGDPCTRGRPTGACAPARIAQVDILALGVPSRLLTVGLGPSSPTDSGGELMQHEPSTPLVVYEPLFADGARLALAGFLAGYRGATRDAYALVLRQFVAWCADGRLSLSSVCRADIENYARTLEERGRAQATVARRRCTVAGFYRYAEEEGLWPSPRRCMCADPGWTTSRTPSVWTATRWALCWWRPGWDRRSSTP